MVLMRGGLGQGRAPQQELLGFLRAGESRVCGVFPLGRGAVVVLVWLPRVLS